MKKCVYRGCDNQVSGRKKYCSDNHKYRESQCRKDTVGGWGSINSQMRLNKRTARFAKRMRAGNTVRYN